MLFSEWLSSSSSTLKKANIASARLDCLLLAEDVLHKDRTWLLAHPEHKLTSADMKKLAAMIKRRSKHEPLAYIRGKSEFYGREFYVTPATLQPRPETETMLNMFLSSLAPKRVRPLCVVDVGTGSGCIGITVKLERPELTVLASEVNEDALAVAKKNAKKHNAHVDIRHGNLLQPVLSELDETSVILCNLPYVPNDFGINKAAMQEPRVAIFGGDDGLDLYREMFAQLYAARIYPKHVYTEALPPQHKDLSEIAKGYGYTLTKTQDLIQKFTYK